MDETVPLYDLQRVEKFKTSVGFFFKFNNDIFDEFISIQQTEKSLTRF